MRKKVALLLCILLATAFFASCQAASTSETAGQKDLEQLIDKAAAQGDTQGASLAEYLKAPSTYTASFDGNNGNLTVNANASVTIPDTAGISAMRVSRHYFTQEEADKMMEVFLQGETLYEAAHPLTKAEIQDRLDRLNDMRGLPDAAAAAGADPRLGKFEEKIQGDIETYESMLADAPETMEPVPADTTFHPSDVATNPDAQVIEGISTVHGKTYYLLINNGFYNKNNVEAVFTTGGGSLDGSYISSTPYYTIFSVEELSGVQPSEILKITESDAKLVAEELLTQLGLTDMACVDVQYAGVSEEISRGNTDPEQLKNGKWAYSLQYQRTVNGIPATLTGHTGVMSEDDVSVPWPYERLRIIVDETGLESFEYTSPTRVEETVTENASLLGFSEITSVFEKMLPVTYGYLAEETDYRLQLDITEVRLGLMRITGKDSRDTGLMIPVWDFIGDLITVPDEGEPSKVSGGPDSLLTINAIDGSVIDRGLGY